MAIDLRQSTASQEIPLGYFLDSADGNTEETGLTIANTDIKIWKTGATTLANKNSGGATHISNGIYYCVLDATDTDTIGPLVVFIHVTGALAVRVECNVLDEAVYDVKYGTTAPSTFAAGGNVNTNTITNGAITAAAIATGAIDADAIAADAVTEIQAGLSTLDAAGVRTAVGLATANLDTQLAAIDDAIDTEVASILAAVDTEVAAIKAKTDNLPADPADASDIAAAFAVTDGLITTVDTVVDAIKVKTDSLTFTTAGQVDANIQYINDVALTGDGSATPWGPA